jgi:hypothetical protein
MTFAEIEASVRLTLDDNSSADQLWSQSEILEYAQDAENEACERAGLIIDSTSALTDVAVTSTTGTYGIASTIITIDSIKLSLGTMPLIETTERVLDLTIPSWRSESGTTRAYIKTPTNSIMLYPMPTVADTANMTVTRFPTTPMTLLGSPEIDDRYHAGLLFWILHRCYMKNDSETLNVDKAKDYGQQFVTWFGKKVKHGD